VNQEPAQGSVFAGHRIERELGRGGMGVVYEATHEALGRRRALKVLAPTVSGEEAAAERFRREARMAASIDHPALIPVHDAGEADGRLYISMRLIDGVDLALLLREGPLEPARVAAIVRDVGAGLDAAHAAGLVHRDVKPANILVEAGADGREHAYLGDFGIGMLLDADRDRHLTGTGQVLGTIDYMSPEQIEGRSIDGRADVYSLACVAFEALTGTVPFEAETKLAALHAHGSAARPSASARNPSLPPAVDAVLAAAMAIDPEGRTTSAGAFADSLADGLGDARGLHSKPTAPLVARPARTEAPPRRLSPRTVAIGVGGVLVTAAAILVLVLLGGNDDPEEVTAAVTIDVARDPVAVAAGANYVWVASGSGGRVVAYDAATGDAAGINYTVDQPRALALGGDALWAVNAEGLIRLSLDGEEKRVAGVELADPADVALDGRAVWVLDRGDTGAPARAVRVDAKTLEESGDAFVGTDPQGIAYGAGSLWVTNAGDGTVTEIDAREAERVGAPIEVGGRPEAIAASGGRVWVVDNFGAQLIPIDPSGSEPAVGGAVETLPAPRSVALGLDSVWVASGEAGTLQRFSAGEDPELLAEAEVGEDPADVSVGSDRAWTADSGSDTVSGVDP
jgi:tRNA A-37 threonylcarbamoyl transferase component Bud32